MAAALRGAPVSTIDIDLFFRKTPRNMQKLKLVADALEAVILRPYYPVSALFRLHRERDGLQIDFMGHIDGVKSYEGVRGRAGVYQIGGQKLLAGESGRCHPKQTSGWPRKGSFGDCYPRKDTR